MEDWAELEALKDALGASDCLELVDMFTEETQPVLDSLAKGAPLNGMEEDLHFLKGCALNLGLRALGDHCASLESRSMTGGVTPEDLMVLATEARKSAQAARHFLEAADAA